MYENVTDHTITALQFSDSYPHLCQTVVGTEHWGDTLNLQTMVKMTFYYGDQRDFKVLDEMKLK